MNERHGALHCWLHATRPSPQITLNILVVVAAAAVVGDVDDYVDDDGGGGVLRSRCVRYRTKRRSIAVMFVRLSVCLSVCLVRACIVIIRCTLTRI